MVSLPRGCSGGCICRQTRCRIIFSDLCYDRWRFWRGDRQADNFVDARPSCGNSFCIDANRESEGIVAMTSKHWLMLALFIVLMIVGVIVVAAYT